MYVTNHVTMCLAEQRFGISKSTWFIMDLIECFFTYHILWRECEFNMAWIWPGKKAGGWWLSILSSEMIEKKPNIRESPPPLITNIQVLFVDIAWICKVYAKSIYHDQGYISKNTKIIQWILVFLKCTLGHDKYTLHKRCIFMQHPRIKLGYLLSEGVVTP